VYTVIALIGLIALVTGAAVCIVRRSVDAEAFEDRCHCGGRHTYDEQCTCGRCSIEYERRHYEA